MQSRTEKALKQLAVAMAALTYAGAVIYGDVMFLQVMNHVFPTDGVLRVLAMAGTVMTAASAIALPVAMHWWFAPGLQTVWGVLFWLLDIAVLGLNSILAYQVMNGLPTTAWQILSPATPILAVVGWGVAFLLDPSQQRRHAIAEMQAAQIEIFAEQMRQATQSPEVYEEILAGARAQARRFAEGLGERQRAFGGNGARGANADFFRGDGRLPNLAGAEARAWPTAPAGPAGSDASAD
jgi:hypothetical protein